MDLEDLAQMVLAKDHDVIQALSTDRANQPLGVSVLPGLKQEPWVGPGRGLGGASGEGRTKQQNGNAVRAFVPAEWGQISFRSSAIRARPAKVIDTADGSQV